MPKFSIKPAIELAKKAKPIVKEYGPKVIPVVAPFVKDVPSKTIDTLKSYKENKKLNGKVPFRKIRFQQYHSDVLPNLQNFNLLQLKSYINEVKSFITQLEAERNRNIINEKIIIKRITNWQKVLIQLEDVLSNRSYEEFLKMYQAKDYNSLFFEEKIVTDFKNLIEKEDMYRFIKRFSNKSEDEIAQDFY